MKNKIFKFIEKRRKKIVSSLCLVLMMTMFFTESVWANDISTLKLYSGTNLLITAAVGGLTALIGGCGSFFSIKSGYAYWAAEPDEKSRKKKELIVTVVMTIILTCLPATLTWILSYYK